MGRDLGCMVDVLMGFHRSTFSKSNTEFNSDLAPCDFGAFTTMKRELRGKKFRSDQGSAARFREVGEALQEMHRLSREVEVKLSLCLTKHHAMKTYWGVEI
jgi:hypothetical protein